MWIPQQEFQGSNESVCQHELSCSVTAQHSGQHCQVPSSSMGTTTIDHFPTGSSYSTLGRKQRVGALLPLGVEKLGWSRFVAQKKYQTRRENPSQCPFERKSSGKGLTSTALVDSKGSPVQRCSLRMLMAPKHVDNMKPRNCG